MVISSRSIHKLRAVLCKEAVSIYFIRNCRNYDIKSVHKNHQCSYRILVSNNSIAGEFGYSDYFFFYFFMLGTGRGVGGLPNKPRILPCTDKL